ncbi:hypothetical protein ACTJIJ_22450 [Niabella sp. 22666]|uniref:hypothetical protein n=1 Tax=Niabella sp. 22666 TaxID=3453954 RepID=UPI003F82553E
MKRIATTLYAVVSLSLAALAQTEIELSSGTPIQFTSTGLGMYNKTVVYHASSGLYFDLAKNIDNTNGIPIDFGIEARGGTKLFMIKGSNGFVGIGTNSPNAKLHIQNTGSSLGMLIDGNNSSYVGSDLSINRVSTAGGVGQSPAIQFNDGNSSAQIIQGSKNNGLQFFKFFDELGVWKETMRIASNGNLGVGTTNPPLNYKLAVGGKIIAEELKVQSQSAWPDYVFTPTYKLTPLPELEQFIKTHQHLPEVPSAREVTTIGIEVGANQALLLKKIEEITLHLIELNKKVEELQQENQALKKSKRKRSLW